jgi:hypothetical protein
LTALTHQCLTWLFTYAAAGAAATAVAVAAAAALSALTHQCLVVALRICHRLLSVAPVAERVHQVHHLPVLITHVLQQPAATAAAEEAGGSVQE